VYQLFSKPPANDSTGTAAPFSRLHIGGEHRPNSCVYLGSGSTSAAVDSENDPVKPAAGIVECWLSFAHPADIYQNDKYLGLPHNIETSAGRQTLEYRHEDLRALVTHNIRANGDRVGHFRNSRTNQCQTMGTGVP
jgi:hypothetical protein